MAPTAAIGAAVLRALPWAFHGHRLHQHVIYRDLSLKSIARTGSVGSRIVKCCWMEASGVVRVWWVIAFAFSDLFLCLVVVVVVIYPSQKRCRQSLAEAQSSRNGYCLQ
ncbi:hypothetical protein OPV22_008063 [Ensete ventricosum]|uniref:CASP-like protein n=1 Tax=Ensete ventricosum TaxID=4639 RepID=A0AAV8RBV6_ENSVE|nr:hypothetical protein OPV22_008063 [Ensete ventricosum]